MALTKSPIEITEMIQGAGTEPAEQRAQLERLLDEDFMADTPEKYLSVLSGMCSQLLMTILTQSVTSEQLSNGGRRAMSITVALYQKWNGQLTSLLDRLGNYRTTVSHIGDTLRCVLPPGAVVYLNYMQPGTLAYHSDGYYFEVKNMNSADHGFYNTMLGCMVASAQSVLKVPGLYLSKVDQLNTKILELTHAHELSGGNNGTIAPLTVGRWIETVLRLAPDAPSVPDVQNGGIVKGLAEVDGCQGRGPTLSKVRCNPGVLAAASQQVTEGKKELGVLNQLTDMVNQLVTKIAGWEKPEGGWQHHFNTPVEDLPADMESYKVENEGPAPYVRPFDKNGQPFPDPVRLVSCLAEKPLPTSLADNKIILSIHKNTESTTSHQTQDVAPMGGASPVSGSTATLAYVSEAECQRLPNMLRANLESIQDIGYDVSQNFNLSHDKLDKIGQQANGLQKEVAEVKGLVKNMSEVVDLKIKSSERLIEKTVQREVSKVMAEFNRERIRTKQSIKDSLYDFRKARDKQDKSDRPRSKAGTSGRKADSPQSCRGSEVRGIKRASSVLASPETGKRGERGKAEGYADHCRTNKRPPSPAKQRSKSQLLDKSRSKNSSPDRGDDCSGERSKKRGKESRRENGQGCSCNSSGNYSAANNNPASYSNNILTIPTERVAKSGDKDAGHNTYDASPSARVFPKGDPKMREKRSVWPSGGQPPVALQVHQALHGGVQEVRKEYAGSVREEEQQNPLKPPSVITLEMRKQGDEWSSDDEDE